jgi:hypothetical protein
MKTPIELVADLTESVGEMEDHILAVSDLAHVLYGVAAGKVIAEEYIPGMRRMLDEIINRAESLRQLRNGACHAAFRLANP